MTTIEIVDEMIMRKAVSYAHVSELELEPKLFIELLKVIDWSAIYAKSIPVGNRGKIIYNSAVGPVEIKSLKNWDPNDLLKEIL